MICCWDEEGEEWSSEFCFAGELKILYGTFIDDEMNHLQAYSTCIQREIVSYLTSPEYLFSLSKEEDDTDGYS